MSKAMWWIIGLLFGAALGAVAVALFAPVTGREFRLRLNESYHETLEDARQASQARQAQLEAELARLQGKS